MSNENRGTIADIIAEMREFADKDSQSIGRDVLRRRIQNFARCIEQSVASCDQLVNEETMRKALLKASDVLTEAAHHNLTEEYIKECLALIHTALAKPPRNCEVGSVDEQYNRFVYCCTSRKIPCRRSDTFSCTKCYAVWSQTQYEEMVASC